MKQQHIVYLSCLVALSLPALNAQTLSNRPAPPLQENARSGVNSLAFSKEGWDMRMGVALRAFSLAESTQTRLVKDQVLTSTYLPPIRVKFDDQFKYAGTQKFILYERAQVEQFFFVDADSERRIKRLYFAQFEGYLPGVDAKYDYPATETVTLGGQTYIVNAESVPNISAVLKQNPESDAARAVSFLESKGYRLSESIKFQRFVRLVDEAKRNELILVYVEVAGASSAPEKLGKDFSERALKGFTILK